MLGHPVFGGVTPHNWYLSYTIAGVTVRLLLVMIYKIILKTGKISILSQNVSLMKHLKILSISINCVETLNI